MKKIKLQSIEVPWQISPSHEFIDFSGTEGDVKIKLLVQFSSKIRENILDNLEKKYGDNIPDELWNKAGYAIIEIKFSVVYFFSKNVSQQEHGLLSEEKYDFSRIIPYNDNSVSFEDMWNETNICPDPSLYEIVDSDLKNYLGINMQNIKHWMVIGHDVYFDILASEFEWKEIEF